MFVNTRFFFLPLTRSLLHKKYFITKHFGIVACINPQLIFTLSFYFFIIFFVETISKEG